MRQTLTLHCNLLPFYRRQIASPPPPEEVTLKKKIEDVKSRHLGQSLPALVHDEVV